MIFELVNRQLVYKARLKQILQDCYVCYRVPLVKWEIPLLKYLKILDVSASASPSLFRIKYLVAKYLLLASCDPSLIG